MSTEPTAKIHTPEDWESQVKDARRRGDPAATLAIATTAADSIEAEIGEHTEYTAPQRNALTTLQRFTYNAAADAWPGWQLNEPSLDESTVTKAKHLAERSAALVARLQLGDISEATGIWLVGAFDLALGNFDDAITHFSVASQQYRAGSAPGLELLTRGYTVIANGLQAQKSKTEIAEDLDSIITRISDGGFTDGAEWAEQLRTALTVFSTKQDREIGTVV